MERRAEEARRRRKQAEAGQPINEFPARWKRAICPVHGFTVPYDHNLGPGRCTAPQCGRAHELRDFFPGEREVA